MKAYNCDDAVVFDLIGEIANAQNRWELFGYLAQALDEWAAEVEQNAKNEKEKGRALGLRDVAKTIRERIKLHTNAGCKCSVLCGVSDSDAHTDAG